MKKTTGFLFVVLIAFSLVACVHVPSANAKPGVRYCDDNGLYGAWLAEVSVPDYRQRQPGSTYYRPRPSYVDQDMFLGGASGSYLEPVAKKSWTAELVHFIDTWGPWILLAIVITPFVVFVFWTHSIVKYTIGWFQEGRELAEDTNAQVEDLDTRDLPLLLQGQIVALLAGGQVDVLNRAYRRKEVDLRRCDLSGLVLSGLHLNSLVLFDCLLEGVNLDNTTINGLFRFGSCKGACFRNSVISIEFDGVDLEGADFTGSDLGGSRFEDCRLIGVKFDDVKMDDKKLGDLITEKVRQEAEARRRLEEGNPDR